MHKVLFELRSNWHMSSLSSLDASLYAYCWQLVFLGVAGQGFHERGPCGQDCRTSSRGCEVALNTQAIASCGRGALVAPCVYRGSFLCMYKLF